MRHTNRNCRKSGRGMVGILVTLIILALMMYFHLKKARPPEPAATPAGRADQEAAQMRQEAVSSPQKAFDKTKQVIKKDENGRVKDANEVMK